MSIQSVPQLIYETLGNDLRDAASIVGVSENDLGIRRQIMEAFLAENEWDEQKFVVFYREQMDLILRVRHNKELPSTAQMAKNLMSAAVSHLRSGWSKCPPEQSAERYNICKSCEKLRDDGRCAICGCFMDIKSTWKEQKCPIEKW